MDILSNILRTTFIDSFISTYINTFIEWNGTCTEESIITYVVGVFLCVGGILSYLPQYIALINSKQEPMISEAR